MKRFIFGLLALFCVLPVWAQKPDVRACRQVYAEADVELEKHVSPVLSDVQRKQLDGISFEVLIAKMALEQTWFRQNADADQVGIFCDSTRMEALQVRLQELRDRRWLVTDTEKQQLLLKQKQDALKGEALRFDAAVQAALKE